MSDVKGSQRIFNRSGLSAIAYRIGDYATFRDRLLTRLTQLLPQLKTRDPDDAAIALLDAWAVVEDVLTFYQERIANESYLSTATERQSVIELARLIGYELAPGVASSSYLAFTIENKPGGSDSILIPKGTQIMSLPGESGAPQTFETSADFQAHPDWNNVKPRLQKPQDITRETQQLYLAGINTQLSVGDWILLKGLADQKEKQYLLLLTAVQSSTESGSTQIFWNSPLDLDTNTVLRHPEVYAFRQRTGLFGNHAPRWENMANDLKRQAKGVQIKGGIFQVPVIETDAEWKPRSEGLVDADILCLATKDDILFAGTSTGGIFRSRDAGQTWTAANAGLTNLSIQTLYVDERGHLLAGTPGGGVFRSKDNGENWSAIHTGTVRVEQANSDKVKAINTGVPNVIVRSLLAYTAWYEVEQQLEQKYFIFAGTDDSIYHSINQGQDWASDKIPAQSTTDPDYQFCKHLVGLPDKIIYSLLLSRVTGKIQSIDPQNARKITVIDLSAKLNYGETIIVGDQKRKILQISVRCTIDEAFDASVHQNTLLVINAATGKIASTDALNSRKVTVRDLTNRTQSGNVVIANGQTRFVQEIATQLTLNHAFDPPVTQGANVVAIGKSGTIEAIDSNNPARITVNFKKTLQQGDIITVNNQIRYIVATPEYILKLNQPFTPSITPDTSFIFGLFGKIKTINAEEITVSYLRQTLQCEDTVTANGQTRHIKLVETTLDLNQSFDPPVVAGIQLTNSPRILAGTDRGIYISDDNGENWQPEPLIPGNRGYLPDRKVYSLTTFDDQGFPCILAGTDQGVWCSFNQGSSWDTTNQGIFADQTVRSLAYTQRLETYYFFAATQQDLFSAVVPGSTLNPPATWDWQKIQPSGQSFLPQAMTAVLFSSSNLFVGARFSGFVSNATTTLPNSEWPQFQIEAHAIDLDGLYPKILAGSWIALLDQTNTEQTIPQPVTAKITSVSTESRQQFGLDAKVTHLLLDPAIAHPENFGRRTTTVLAQSEPLPLAEESLSVPVQQAKIFQDPLWDNKVFLSQYTAGLTPQKTLIVSGKHIRARVNTGGVFRSRNWQRRSTDLLHNDIQALIIRDTDGALFAATTTKVLQSDDGGKHWQPISRGLEGQNVRAIAAYTKPAEAWANREVIIDREKAIQIIQSAPRQNASLPIFAPEVQPGDIIMAESQKRIVLKRQSVTELILDTAFSEQPSSRILSNRSSNKLLLGTDQGIFRFRADIDQWERIDNASTTTLKNVQVLVVDSNKNYILAGTNQQGVFSSEDGELWQSSQLKDKNTQALTINPANGQIFAGTQKNGVWRSTNKSWTWTSTGLTNLNITALAVYNKLDSVTLAIKGETVTGVGTLFTKLLRIGDSIVVKPREAGYQIVTVANILSDTKLTINHSVPSEIGATPFFFIPNRGSGNLASQDKMVTGIGTDFTKELQPGDYILAANQIKVVDRLDSNTQLTIKQAFQPNLPNGTPFFILDKGQGSIFSTNNIVSGEETAFNTELNVGDGIVVVSETETQIRLITDFILIVDKPLATSQPSPFSIPRRGAGLVYVDGMTTKVRGQGTYFLDEFRKDDLLIVGDEIRIVTDVVSNEELTVQIVFKRVTAQQQHRFFIPRRGAGTVYGDSESTKVRGQGTYFLYEFRKDDLLIVGNEMKVITDIISNEEVLIETAFSSELPQDRNYGKPFFRVDRGTGTIIQSDKSVSGEGTTFNTELNVGDIFIIHKIGGISNPTIEKVNSFHLTIDQRFSETIPEDASKSFSILSKHYLFAATADGKVFRSTNNGNTWKPIGTNFKDANISSLIVDPTCGLVFAGTTQKGVFRSTDNGNLWDSMNAGLGNLSVRSLALQPSLESKGMLLAGTQEGIFHSTADGTGLFEGSDRPNRSEISWEHRNQGLTDTHVQSLAAYQLSDALYLFAGTQSGVFRSLDQGKTWALMSQGLKNTHVQTLLTLELDASPKPNFKVLAGTKEELFCSTDQGKNWQSVNLGLVRPNVQTLAIHSFKNTGETNSQDYLFAATFKQGIFRSADRGLSWIPVGLTKQDVRVLLSTSSSLLVGTYGGGIFRSSNNGSSWEPLTDTRMGKGTISSEGVLVTGEQTEFNVELRGGDKLEANGQIRTVMAITSDTVLTVDQPFKPALSSGTAFTIQTGLTDLYITSLAAIGNDWFAGTAGSGVFHYNNQNNNQGVRWTAINTGLNPNDLEIRCLHVQSIPQSGQQNSIECLLVGTAMSGVFRLMLAQDGTWDSSIWEPFGTLLTSTSRQTELTNIDVRSLLIERGNIYVGGIGILTSPEQLKAVELQRDDLLRVVAAPTAIAPDTDTIQQWQVIDRNQVQGQLTITSPDDIQLEPAAEEDPTISEKCVILKAPDDEEHPILTLEQSLQYSYDPASATIYANVVEATHGATISEILGSGNGTLTNQQFTLSKPPLTHTAAMTPSGGKSSLNVYVNDVKWTEDSSLYALNTQNQSYILQIEDDGTTIITFGDGQRGARLPSGRENITATYRSGMGLSGQIEAGQISLKKTGPASILSVTNPLPASGAADPESITSAQKSVPATTRTLDRIVSLQDFEDFAQAFAGVAQAQAVALWNGETELVHITIAAIAGATVTPESALYQSLVQAINAARDPIQQVQIDSYLPKFFRLEAKFFVLPRYQSDKVEADIRKQLTEKFAFDRRQFGQAVTKSEVIAAIQSVDGVQAVGLDALHYRDASRTLQSVLLAQTAHWDSQTRQIQPAQLLRLNASDIVLTLVQSL